MIDTLSKLPHKDPVRFIKTVQKEEDDYAVSLVEFKDVPTLSTVVEAAAQNIIFIKSIFKDSYKGVLTGMKNIELLGEIDKGIYTMHTKKIGGLDNFFVCNFECFKEGKKIAHGEISIYRESK